MGVWGLILNPSLRSLYAFLLFDGCEAAAAAEKSSPGAFIFAARKKRPAKETDTPIPDFVEKTNWISASFWKTKKRDRYIEFIYIASRYLARS